MLLLNGTGSATTRQLNTEALLKKDQPVKAIPYYSWNNRGSGEMVVWIPYVETAARPKPAPTIASKSKISGSINNQRMLSALNDQFEPSNSEDKSALYLHWWPKKIRKSGYNMILVRNKQYRSRKYTGMMIVLLVDVVFRHHGNFIQARRSVGACTNFSTL